MVTQHMLHLFAVGKGISFIKGAKVLGFEGTDGKVGHLLAVVMRHGPGTLLCPMIPDMSRATPFQVFLCSCQTCPA